jgi:putative membrane protein
MKLSKLSIPYRAAQGILTLVFFGFFSGVDVARFDLTAAAVILGATFTGFVAISAWFYLVWRNFEFEVTDDTFDIRSGVLHRQVREIPLKRIQNVDVRRNIVHRILGIAKVNLETAGGKSTEASLKYVDFDVAKEIQDDVRRLKQDVEEHEEEDSESIFEITNRELGILSLTSVSSRAIAAGFGVMSLTGLFSQQVESAIGFSSFIAVMIVFALSIAVMFVGSAVTNFSQFYGFRLFKRGDSLEYERGLINRSEGSIPLEKIQVVSLEENPLKRFFGYATLKIETAGYGPGNQENTGAEVAVPLAERKRIEQLSQKIIDHSGFRMQGVSKMALRRYFGRYILASTAFSGMLLGAVYLAEISFSPYYLLLLVPVSGVAAYLKYVNKGFYEGTEHFYTMNGFWNRKTSIAPYYRIQTLDQVQTVFQKRLGLKSLVLDTAGTSVFGSNPKVCDLDMGTADNLFDRIYDSFRNSRM